jgi:hypothetical protein
LLKFFWLKGEGRKKKSRQPSAGYVVFLTKAAPTDQGGGKRRQILGDAVELLVVLQDSHCKPSHSRLRFRVQLTGVSMSAVKFPGRPKRRPFAVAAFDPKRERMLLRAERVVELLSSRAIRDGWSFDKNRAARFLHCLRTFDRNTLAAQRSPK